MIHTIYTLTLGAYLKIICHDQINLLKKYPFPIRKVKLYDALSTILNDYRTLSTNDELRSNVEVEKRRERLNRAYLEIYAAIKILCYKESIESYQILRKYYIISGDESRIDSVKKAISNLKSRKIEIDTMKVKEVKKPQMADYLHEIQILRKEGFQIDLDKTTVAEYVQIQNIAYENYIKNGRARDNQQHSK